MKFLQMDAYKNKNNYNLSGADPNPKLDLELIVKFPEGPDPNILEWLRNFVRYIFLLLDYLCLTLTGKFDSLDSRIFSK